MNAIEKIYTPSDKLLDWTDKYGKTVNVIFTVVSIAAVGLGFLRKEAALRQFRLNGKEN